MTFACLPLNSQNFQDGFAPEEAWSWTALSERFGESMVRVSLSETGRCEEACFFFDVRLSTLVRNDADMAHVTKFTFL